MFAALQHEAASVDSDMVLNKTPHPVYALESVKIKRIVGTAYDHLMELRVDLKKLRPGKAEQVAIKKCALLFTSTHESRCVNPERSLHHRIWLKGHAKPVAEIVRFRGGYDRQERPPMAWQPLNPPLLRHSVQDPESSHARQPVPTHELVFAELLREHSKSWGADGVGLGSGLTERGWAGAEAG